jgi:hypothetical protein
VYRLVQQQTYIAYSIVCSTELYLGRQSVLEEYGQQLIHLKTEDDEENDEKILEHQLLLSDVEPKVLLDY